MISKKSTDSKPTGTNVLVILDKSGSMLGQRFQTISAINEYFTTLRKDSKSSYSVYFTLFDTEVTHLAEGTSLSEMGELEASEYLPDGMTALYDAIGSTLRRASEAAKNFCVIFTDGQENSSKTDSSSSINNLISAKRATGNWEFVFLGCDRDAWVTGQQMGIILGGQADPLLQRGIYTSVAANTMSYSHGGTVTNTTLTDASNGAIKAGDPRDQA